MGTSFSLCWTCLPCREATQTAQQLNELVTWDIVTTCPATPSFLPWSEENVKSVGFLDSYSTQPALAVFDIDYCLKLLQSINQFRKSRLFTDIALVVGKKEVLVHLNVLATLCQNMEKMLNVNDPTFPVRIPVVGQESELFDSNLESILTACYTQTPLPSQQLSNKHAAECFRESTREVFEYKAEDGILKLCIETNPAENSVELAYLHVLSKLETYRMRGNFCDVTITTEDGRSLHCHKNVLAGGSEFFQGLFLSGMRETQENCVDLSVINGEVMDSILRYLYTGEIDLNFDNVAPILEASDYLLINSLKEKVVRFLEQNLSVKSWWLSRSLAARYNCRNLYLLTSNLSPSNVCDIRSLAQQHDYEDLWETAGKYMHDNFALIYQTEGFLSLSLDDMTLLVSSESLQISEELLFKALLRWIMHDVTVRKTRLPALARFIHMNRLPNNLFNQELDNVSHSLSISLMLLAETKEQLKGLINAKEEGKILADEVDANILEERGWVALEQKVKGAVHSMQVSNFCILCVNRVSSCAFLWIPLESALFEFRCPDRFRLHEVVQHKHSLYAILSVNKCTCSDISELPTSSFNDDENASIASQCEPEGLGKIIVELELGGVRSVRKYQAEGTLKDVKSIDHHLFHYAVCSLDDCIYLLGGYRWDDTKLTPLATVQRYNTTNDAWKEMQGMNTPRVYHCVAVLHQALFVIGGVGENGTRLSSMEKYILETNTWVDVTSLNSPRWAASCYTLNDKLYVLGGFDSTCHSVRYCEVYDPRIEQWQILENILAQPYDGFLAVTNLAGVNIIVEKAAGNKLFVYGLDIDTGKRSDWAWTVEIPSMPEITDILPLNRGVMSKLMHNTDLWTRPCIKLSW